MSKSIHYRDCFDCVDFNTLQDEGPCGDCEDVINKPAWRSKNGKATETKDSALKDSGDRTQFETGAVRDMHQGKGRCDLLPPLALLRLARHFENGAIKYGERNWEKGIPCHSFLDSALRHMFKYMAGNTDEDHLVAALWNIVCLAETEEKQPHMMDIPNRMEGKDE